MLIASHGTVGDGHFQLICIFSTGLTSVLAGATHQRQSMSIATPATHNQADQQNTSKNNRGIKRGTTADIELKIVNHRAGRRPPFGLGAPR